MKKHVLMLLIIVSIMSLSSCDLFKCKHKEYDVKTVAPNCFAEGYTEHTCKKCGESYKDNILPKTIHYFAGQACPNCDMEEITETITPDTEWYSESAAVFNITTAEQLAGFASLVNSGTDFAGRIIYLDADIDLGFYEWIPIGNADFAFNGSFDGDGHTVFGLKINANYDYVGLFGNVNGKICNVTIDQANVYVKRDHSYVSILCGYSSGEIKQISTKGFIEAPKSNYVGGIVGAAAPASIIYSDLTNEANINASNYVGGIFGHINSTGSLQTDSITNTGNVTGVSQIGGIVGYAKAAVGSKIYDASVSADILGEYYVGGIAGKIENVAITTCTNEGSTVTATSYFTEGENFYAWLGGYVGYGYSVDNCVNNVDIKYDARGTYVGGIIGYATDVIQDCTNNGDITTHTSGVGGVVGEMNSTTEFTISNLTNNGNVTGASSVGGVIGSWYHVGNKQGKFCYNLNEVGCNGGSYCQHHYTTPAALKNITNTGNVVSKGDNCGGIIGAVSLQSTFETAYRHCCTYSVSNHGGHVCTFIGNVNLITSELENAGSVSGNISSGEIFGSFSSDGPSTLTNYTVTGKVTVNDEVLEGEYDVGTNTNLSLAGREVPGAENTEVTE